MNKPNFIPSKRKQILALIRQQKDIAKTIGGGVYIGVWLFAEDEFSRIIFGKYFGSLLDGEDSMRVRFQNGVEYLFECGCDDLKNLFKQEEDDVITKLKFELYDITVPEEPFRIYKCL